MPQAWPRPARLVIMLGMARKKKKSAASPARPSRERPGPFNAPFAGLAKALEKAPPPAPEAKTERPRPEPEPPDEAGMFAAAMSDVTLLDAGQKDRVPPPPGQGPRLDLMVDEDLEVMAHLADLVAGGGEFDLRHSDEFVQGAVEGVGPELMERLLAGAFPVQDYLDLHGATAEDALNRVEEYLLACSTKGLRHVLIVHGKGTGSPGGVPVLKNLLARALGQKRLARRVLAFCTAQPTDGGTGAMYVLLRRWSGPKGAAW